jgi:membrane protease YdiL (CAAX protease family)
VQTVARRNPLTFFLTVTYIATIVIFAVPFLSNAGIGVIDLDMPGAAPFILLSTISLTAAAFVTTALADGRPGVRDLRSRTFRFRVNPIWYIVAFLLLPAVGVATAVALGGFDAIGRLANADLLVNTLLVGGLSAFLLINWWEEVGWTGFVLDRLQRRTHPVWASVVTAWLQGAIHLPLVFIADGVTDGRVRPEDYPFYFVALFVLPIPVRIIATWLYNASGRSLPIVGIFHAGLGIATGTAFVPEIAPGFATVWVYAAFAIVAGAVLLVTRGRLALERQRVTHGELMLAAGAT